MVELATEWKTLYNELILATLKTDLLIEKSSLTRRWYLLTCQYSFHDRAKKFINSRNDVIYFADTNFVYDVKIFDEIRSIDNIGMLPVGLVEPLGIRSFTQLFFSLKARPYIDYDFFFHKNGLPYSNICRKSRFMT